MNRYYQILITISSYKAYYQSLFSTVFLWGALDTWASHISQYPRGWWFRPTVCSSARLSLRTPPSVSLYCRFYPSHRSILLWMGHTWNLIETPKSQRLARYGGARSSAGSGSINRTGVKDSFNLLTRTSGGRRGLAGGRSGRWAGGPIGGRVSRWAGGAIGGSSVVRYKFVFL